jgi:hypothetical protein
MATNAPRGLQVYDPVLSNLARSYRPDGLIARSLIPSIPVKKLSAQYPVFPQEYWYRQHTDTLIVDRAPAREVDFEWSMENFLCREYALKVSLTDLEEIQAIPELQLRRNKTELLTTQMELAYEVKVAALLNTQDAGGGLDNAMDATPSTNWDQDTATIEADIKAGVLAVYDAIGRKPNTMIIPFKVAYAMAVQEDIRAIMRYDAAGKPVNFIELGQRTLPSVIHGMRVIISEGAQIDTTNEGAAAGTLTEIWGDDVRLLYINPKATWGIPTVAYRFDHTPKKVTRFSTVDPDIEYAREMERYDLKVVAPQGGFILKDVLS